jgi:galactofuranose transport system permease protein
LSQVQTQTPPPASTARVDAITAIMRFSTLGALVALIVFNMFFTNHFLAMQTLDVNLTQVATIVIVGVGMTLVIATGGIDLSVGSLMAISGAIAPIIFLNKVVNIGEVHVAVAVSMIVAILLAGAFGWFNGWLITRFRIQPIIATRASVRRDRCLQGPAYPGRDHDRAGGRRRLGAQAQPVRPTDSRHRRK